MLFAWLIASQLSDIMVARFFCIVEFDLGGCDRLIGYDVETNVGCIVVLGGD
ncbi:hypothetical protein QUA56_32050 [Microcoleus sp. N3A4]|uniref:hypothetical protein n=1 Tax=Microcoleus sp. N3A4 TaxID=3055379 RepID=UPI002FD120EB